MGNLPQICDEGKLKNESPQTKSPEPQAATGGGGDNRASLAKRSVLRWVCCRVGPASSLYVPSAGLHAASPSLFEPTHSPFSFFDCRSIVRSQEYRSAAYAPSLRRFRRPVASQAYSIGTTPGITTGVGLPEPATRPIEAKYRAILGP